MVHGSVTRNQEPGTRNQPEGHDVEPASSRSILRQDARATGPSHGGTRFVAFSSFAILVGICLWGVLICSSLARGEGAGTGLIRLKSGREVLVGEKRLETPFSRDLYREARRFLKEGRIDWVLENCHLLKEKGAEEVIAEADDLITKIRKAEYSSVVVLKNGQTYRGKVTAQLNPDYLGLQGQKVIPQLRTDYLGLDGQEKVPFWSVRSIHAEYRAVLSRISGYYYLSTLLNIQFRGKGLVIQQTSHQESSNPLESTISKEILIQVEDQEGNLQKAAMWNRLPAGRYSGRMPEPPGPPAEGGALSRPHLFVLGHDYQMLKGESLQGQVEELTRDRVQNILFYPLLEEVFREENEKKE